MTVETLKRIFRVRVANVEQQPVAISNIPKNLRTRHDKTVNMGYSAPPQTQKPNQPQFPGQPQQRPQKVQPIKVEQKVGRNDDCPCGSGRKYKKCHGRG